MTNRKLLIGTAILLVAVFGVAAWLYKGSAKKEATAKLQANQDLLVRSHSPAMGPADAPVTIVEFLDPECEACRRFHPVVKTVMGEFPDKIRLIVRYMPFHKNSMYAASILEVARERGKYWEALETLFKHQPEWGSHHDPKPELIIGYLEGIGLKRSDIEEALKDFTYRDRVLRDQADGQALGVTGTPAFFVNGNRLERLGYEPLKVEVQRALAGR